MEIALRKRISDVIEEYNLKKAAIKEILKWELSEIIRKA